MTKLLFAASAAAILTVAGHMPAMAQSSMSAPMITCRDLTTMDRETARSVVFYMSGFRAASGSQSAASTGTSDTSGSTAADAGSSTSGSSGSTTGTTSDTTGSTTAAGGSSGSSDTSGTSASGSTGASSTMVAQLPGFSGIDVDKIMTECASSPDKQISDMVGTGSSQ